MVEFLSITSMVSQLNQRMIHGHSKMVNLVRSMKPKVSDVSKDSSGGENQ